MSVWVCRPGFSYTFIFTENELKNNAFYSFSVGIMGCEWCQIDVDGYTYFSSPFCTHQTSCYNGVLGGITPYGDGDLGTPIADLIIVPAYSALGPALGAIIALCLVIGFAMYCYRKNLDSGKVLNFDSL